MTPKLPIFQNGYCYLPYDDISYPWENKVELPPFKNKAEYRQWHAHTKDALCPHFSCFEGINPRGPISADNPPFRVHGIVGDYDAKMTEAEFEAGLAFQGPHIPYAVNRTFSGGVRAVWMFEKPIFFYDKRTWKSASDLLRKRLKMDQYWKALDADLLAKPEQTYVCGRHWKVSGKVVPADFMAELAYDTAKNAKIGPSFEFKIPPEEILKRANELYPGRVPPSLAPGTRCIRFWVPTADNPTGALIRENGATCFTGDKGFYSWSEILGAEFCANFRTSKISQMTSGLWMSAESYYAQRNDGQWVALTAEELQRHLRVSGVSSEKAKGETASPMDIVVDTLKFDAERWVAAACPFALRPERVVVWNGERYLNTSRAKLMQPSPIAGEFPWLDAFFKRLFPDEKNREHFLAWLRHWYKTALTGNPQRGQAIFICGDTSTGKTFLSNVILSAIFGGHEIATKTALGDRKYNSALTEKALWVIDDAEAFAAGGREHMKLTNFTKAVVANPSIEFEKKYGFACALPFEGRLVTTLNKDERSVSVLPEPIPSILDKVNFYLGGDDKMGNWDQEILGKELPFFLYWLEHSENPAWVGTDKRLGIASFQDPSLLLRARTGTKGFLYLEVIRELFRIKIEAFHQEPKNREKRYNEYIKVSDIARDINSNPDLRGLMGGRQIHPRWFWREISEEFDRGGVAGLKVEKHDKFVCVRCVEDELESDT